MDCKNCGVRIIKIITPEGERWAHLEEALTTYKNMYVYCRLSLAEPTPEPCSTCQDRGGYSVFADGKESIHKFCPDCGRSDPLVKGVSDGN